MAHRYLVYLRKEIYNVFKPPKSANIDLLFTGNAFFLCRSTIPLKNLAQETSEPPGVTFTWPMFSFVKDVWMLQILYTVKYVKFIAIYIHVLEIIFWYFSF